MVKTEPTLLDPGCAERGCMSYSPFSGDTECVEFYKKEYVDKLQTDLDIALSYMKQYELEIAQLKVAYSQEQYRSKQWQERFESGRLT